MCIRLPVPTTWCFSCAAVQANPQGSMLRFLRPSYSLAWPQRHQNFFEAFLLITLLLIPWLQSFLGVIVSFVPKLFSHPPLFGSLSFLLFNDNQPGAIWSAYRGCVNRLVVPLTTLQNPFWTFLFKEDTLC